MRIFASNVAVFERARLRFVGVADQIDRPLFVRLNEAPFKTARKSRPTATAQLGVFNFIDNFGARHRQRLFHFFVPAIAQVTIDICCPILASDAFENEAMFERMRGSPRSGGLWSAVSRWAVWRPPFLEISTRFWIDIFAQLFTDHADWRGAAARQTFDKLDAVITIGADRNGIVHSVAMAPAINSRRRTQIFHQPITIGHGTTEGAADADMRFSCRLLAKHRIKRNQLEDVDRLQP